MNFLPTPEIKPADLVAEYVELRTAKKAYEDQVDALIKTHFTDRMRAIEMQLLDHLNTTGLDNVSGAGATAYKKLNTNVTVSDAREFREYVMETGRFDLIDWRAAKTAVMEQVKEEGILPPGLNYSTHVNVGIRKK